MSTPRLAGLIAVAIVVGLLAAGGRVMAESRVVDLAIRGAGLAKEQQVIRVQQGEEVTLRWTSDAPMTIHLHGYDLAKKLEPGVPATMEFRARAAGRFPIELHRPGKGEERTIGYLEVHPR